MHKKFYISKGDIEYETMLKLCHDKCPKYETCVKEGYKKSTSNCVTYKKSIDETTGWAKRERLYRERG